MKRRKTKRKKYWYVAVDDVSVEFDRKFKYERSAMRYCRRLLKFGHKIVLLRITLNIRTDQIERVSTFTF